MKNSTAIRLRNALVGMSLAVLYGVFVVAVVYGYVSKPQEKVLSPYLTFGLAWAIFVVLCSHFSRVMMFLTGAAAVVILAATLALIHFYFSERYGGLDFAGTSGAWNLALVLGAVYMYMFLGTAGLAIAVKHVRRKIFLYRRSRRNGTGGGHP